MPDPIKPTLNTATTLPSTTSKDTSTTKTTTDGIVADGEDHNPVKDTDSTTDPE